MESSLRSVHAAKLNGARLLVVEDDFLLLMELETILREAGAEGVEACRTINHALALLEEGAFSAALLDVRVGDTNMAPVASKLAARGIPFIFYTGQLRNEAVTAEWPESRIISKPAQPHVIVSALAALASAQKS